MKQKLLVLGIAAILAGCGSDDSDDSPATGGTGGSGGGGGGTTTTEITGSAMAPGGAVAQFRQESPFQVALNFLISPAAAAITGLSPVASAEVKLIRVDNNGDQVGDVLDTATTDAQGAYTLDLPEGEEMGGDLVVEIAGTGTAKMRAQVTAAQVDVTPVSEYVLQKFIAKGADLASLPSTSITELKDKVDDLDLDAGTDLTSLLTALDEQVGEFVEDSIEVIVAAPADGSTITGEYRNVAVQWGLANQPWGSTYAVDSWITDITVSAGSASGTVDFALGTEDMYYMNLNLTSGGVFYEAGLEELAETLTLAYVDGLVSFSQPIEEDIDQEIAERTPAKVYKFHQVPGADLFVLEGNDTSTLYEAVDSNNDGTADSFGEEVIGQQAFRGVEFLMKKPSAASNASLQGDFGRVYLGTSIFNAGWMELESEQNVITFDGAGSLASSAAAQYVINRNVDGVISSSSCQAGAVDCAAAESGISYTLNSDGSFGEIGGGTGPNIFVNDELDFLAGTEFFAIDEDGMDGIEGRSHSLTVMVKLPTTGAPTIGSKVYRVIQVENEWNSQLSLNMARPSSLLTMAGETQGSLDLTWSDLDLDPAQAPLLVMETGSEADVPVSVSVAANGAATFSATDGNATLVLEGFFNEDASFGVFQTRMNPTGELPSALGLAVLIEVTQ